MIVTATSYTNQQKNDTSDSEPKIYTKTMQDTISPDQVLQRLHKYEDYREQFKQTAAVQYPYSTVLTCIDSHSGVEPFLDMSIGATFITRAACF